MALDNYAVGPRSYTDSSAANGSTAEDAVREANQQFREPKVRLNPREHMFDYAR